MDESEIMVNEIEKALKQFILFAINTRCQGVSAPSVTWIIHSRPTYLVQQMSISYIKIIILKS